MTFRVAAMCVRPISANNPANIHFSLTLVCFGDLIDSKIVLADRRDRREISGNQAIEAVRKLGERLESQLRGHPAAPSLLLERLPRFLIETF